MERKRYAFIGFLAIALVFAAPVWAQTKAGSMKTMEGTEPAKRMKPMMGMGGMKMPADAPMIPPVTGYSEGQEILFVHTEISDPKIAKILTDMMGGSPVLVVPALAKIPKELRARVYVFTNGLSGDGPKGPLGFQPDVFDAPPGQPNYSPLRAINLLTWREGATPRLLKAASEIHQALAAGEMIAEEPGVVVNMPFLTWPGGSR